MYGQTVPFVSVIIPARNEECYIRQCLESVLTQTYPRDRMEVLVVDNGSSDATPRIAEELLQTDGRGRVLHKVGGTIASVRNHGWRHAKGEILAFLDGDSVVESEWLKKGIKLLQSESDISCVGFAVAPPAPSESWAERTWFPISSSGKHRGTKAVRWLSSFNLLLRRDFFEQIGGFDESLVTCEDADLGNRLSTFSRLIFSDSSRVRHLGTVKSVREFLCKEYWRGQNSIRSFLKSKIKSSELLSVFVPSTYLILWIIWVVTAIIAPIMGQGALLLLIVTILVLLLPLMLALRAGIRTPGRLMSTSALYALYLLARGVAIVCFRR